MWRKMFKHIFNNNETRKDFSTIWSKVLTLFFFAGQAQCFHNCQNSVFFSASGNISSSDDDEGKDTQWDPPCVNSEKTVFRVKLC